MAARVAVGRRFPIDGRRLSVRRRCVMQRGYKTALFLFVMGAISLVGVSNVHAVWPFRRRVWNDGYYNNYAYPATTTYRSYGTAPAAAYGTYGTYGAPAGAMAAAPGVGVAAPGVGVAAPGVGVNAGPAGAAVAA